MRNSRILLLVLAATFFAPNALSNETLPAKEYVQFTDTPEIPADRIQWHPQSGATLTLKEGQRPTLELKGSVGKKRQLWIGDAPVSDAAGNFTFPLVLPPEPLTILIRVANPAERTFETYQRSYYWIKNPPSIRFKVMEGAQIISKSAGYTGKIKRQAFTQLTSKGTPATVVDLDTVRYTGFAFQITYPKESGEDFDGWSLSVRTEQQVVVSEIKRYGSPPAYVDLSEFLPKLPGPGKYFYRTDLYQDETVYDGADNSFEATSSQLIQETAGMPTVYLEAKQELGYLTFKNDENIDFGGLYAGVDVPVTIHNRYILRGSALFVLPRLSATNQMSVTRGGIGAHFFDLLGARVDTLLTYTHYSLSPSASIQSLSQIGLLIEPHILFRNTHYILPHIEIAGDSSLKSMRGSLGVSYQIFVRPWSMRLGVGVSYDRLFKYPDRPSMHFGLFRMATSVTFII